MRTKILAVLAVTSLVVAFQNCGKVRNSGVATGSADSASSSSGASVDQDNNLVKNGLGQSLAFTSDTGERLVITAQDTSQANQITMKIFNPYSGRKTVVVVKLDPINGQFASVQKVGKPYMCLNPAADYCAQFVVPAGFSGAGAPAVNCSSPIIFAGALTGSVDNLVANAHSVYCGN